MFVLMGTNFPTKFKYLLNIYLQPKSNFIFISNQHFPNQIQLHFLLFYRVVSGSRDASLRMWDIMSGECLHLLVGHVAAVRCVQYDGRLVVSGAYDYMVKVI